MAALEREGRLQVLLGSNVRHIGTDAVELALADGSTSSLPNDYVVVCAGGELPTPLLKAIGIRFETKFGRA